MWVWQARTAVRRIVESNAHTSADDANSEEEPPQDGSETETLLTAVPAKPTIWVIAYNEHELSVFWVRCISLPIICQSDVDIVADRLYTFFHTVLCIGKAITQKEQLMKI